jgi:hypothetical protein
MTEPTYTATGTPTRIDPTGRPATDDDSEFDRFRNLAEKLARVPKHEIDAEQAEEKERNAPDGQH